MKPTVISNETARRFVLGKQGLWPGRRWMGRNGLEQALRSIGSVQMDPLNVTARSHHLALWGRVAGYATEDLAALMYEERKFFDYGGLLCIHSMDDLPFWRIHMERCNDEPRWATFRRENEALIRDVLTEVEARGPLGNRDLAGTARVTNYRGGKDSTVALYYLWLTGDLMIHHRRGFDRVYDLRDRIAPAEVNHVASLVDTEDHFARTTIGKRGIVSERTWKNQLGYRLRETLDLAEARRRLAALVDLGVATPVELEGTRGAYYILAGDVPDLELVAAGGIPGQWEPVAISTSDEAVFLAPLDVVSSAGRAKELFGFEYLWEVYKPASKRRWGYYTLPILWGDRLVARLDPKLDRDRNVLVVNGFWLEDEATGNDPAFIVALARGLRRFADFLGAGEIEGRRHRPARIETGTRAHPSIGMVPGCHHRLPGAGCHRGAVTRLQPKAIQPPPIRRIGSSINRSPVAPSRSTKNATGTMARTDSG